MNKKITIGILALGLVAMSFKMAVDKANANVSSIDGINVFAYSKPIAKYDILGAVKVTGIVKNDRGPHMVELLVEDAKKNFPSGEAIIIGADFFKAEVIRFKE